MRKAVLDTSFLISAVRWRIELFSQLAGFELYLVPAVVGELSKIATGRGKDAVAAKVALGLAKGFKILPIKERSADAALLAAARQGWAVATQDRALIKRLKDLDTKTIIFIKQRKYVLID